LGSSEVRAIKEDSLALSSSAAGEGMLEKILSSVNQLVASTDRTSIKTYIMKAGVPVYQSDPANPKRIIQINPDGSRVSGNVRKGSFVPAETRRKVS